MGGGIDAVWQQIMAWLRIRTPVTATTLRPPAPAGEIQATCCNGGALTDGVDDEHDYPTAFSVPGGYMPLAVARARQEWARLSRYPDNDCCRPGGHHLRSAGDTTFGYCTALIPICRGLDGAVLAVDLRTGTKHARIMNWMAQTGAHSTLDHHPRDARRHRPAPRPLPP